MHGGNWNKKEVPGLQVASFTNVLPNKPFLWLASATILYLLTFRFDKCLKMGMKLEAIREDRTRGGRSTYQCSYTIPAGLGGHASLPPGIPEHRADRERSAKIPDIPILLQVL